MPNPKSDELESNQQPVGARFSKLAPSAPQQRKSKDPGDIHQRVEDPIRQDLHPDVAECLLLQFAQKMANAESGEEGCSQKKPPKLKPSRYPDHLKLLGGLATDAQVRRANRVRAAMLRILASESRMHLAREPVMNRAAFKGAP